MRETKHPLLETPPPVAIEDLRLHFDLPDPKALSDENPVRVKAGFTVRTDKDGASGAPIENFVLDIQKLAKGGPQTQSLQELRLDGRVLTLGEDYEIVLGRGDRRHIVFKVPVVDGARIETSVHLRPDLNQSGEGLYVADGTYVTQNEEEGFREIIPFPDRPSVPIRGIETTVDSDKAAVPVGLSNGDLQAQEDLNGTTPPKTRSVWKIDLPMPSYLYALVAGKLEVAKATHETRTGRNISLEAYTDPGNSHRTNVAMQALKKAMEMDEDPDGYAFEFPFKQMKMAAVSAFNAQAMENNTLVVFKDQAILADPKLSTDATVRNVAAVTAHEYFHTLTGNRVTVKNFNEPALKEGFTAYRDGRFSAEVFGPAQDAMAIQYLRELEFLESASPFAHPIFPGRQWEAPNLYDATTYEKGAFLYGVLQATLGDKGFYAGMRLYRDRFEGGAANFDDLIKAMSDANEGRDLSGFARWFRAAGTPALTAQWTRGKAEGEWVLTLRQTGPDGMPVSIPLDVGFIDAQGRPLTAQQNDASAETHTLMVDGDVQSFTFKGLGNEPPIATFGTHKLPIQFSAPDESEAALAAQITAKGLDPLLRYEAAQRLWQRAMLAAYEGEDAAAATAALKQTMAAVLTETEGLDPEMKAMILTPPGVRGLSLRVAPPVDFAKLTAGRKSILREVAKDLAPLMEQSFVAHESRAVDPGVDLSEWNEEAQKRALRVKAMEYLNAADTAAGRQLIFKVASDADAPMTERQAALGLAYGWEDPAADRLIAQVEKEWQATGFRPLMDDLNTLKAGATRKDMFAEIKVLTETAFAKGSVTTTDIIYTALGFVERHPGEYHARYSETYEWLADVLLRVNAQGNGRIGLRVAKSMVRDVDRLPPENRAKLGEILLRISQDKTLLAEPAEIIALTLDRMGINHGLKFPPAEITGGPSRGARSVVPSSSEHAP